MVRSRGANDCASVFSCTTTWLLGLRNLRSRTTCEPAKHPDWRRLVLRDVSGIDTKRRPEAVIDWKPETLGHYADHCVCGVAESNHLPDDSGVAAETGLPHCMSKQHDCR